MLSIGQLGRQLGVSRTTILYYERAGLLQAGCRSAAGYRCYSEAQRQRLEAILAYRALGVPVAEIAALLGEAEEGGRERLLQQQLQRLDGEIQRLRQQQAVIVRCLQQAVIEGKTMINVERWTDIMRAAGLSDEDMHNWHRQFEKMEPEAHREFLESLGIEAQRVAEIRSWSRQ